MNVSGQNENGDLNYSVKTMGELSLESSFFKEKKKSLRGTANFLCCI